MKNKLSDLDVAPHLYQKCKAFVGYFEGSTPRNMSRVDDCEGVPAVTRHVRRAYIFRSGRQYRIVTGHYKCQRQCPLEPRCAPRSVAMI